MTEHTILVIGGGPAGVSAAIELAKQGFQVILAEQRDRLGGAIHRAFVGSGASQVATPGRHRRNWQQLEQQLAQAQDRISIRLESVFLGIDGDGRILLDDRGAGRVISMQPKAVVIALGAIEFVAPVVGWELPGVITAGGMQVQLKETGIAPVGPILIAGNGPLPLALAAQLTAAGNPPLAVLESGQPFKAAFKHVRAALNGLRAPANAAEALAYWTRLLRAGVPYRTGWSVTGIEAQAAGLRVTSRRHDGAIAQHEVRHLALHDGLTPNHHAIHLGTTENIFMIRAGDCREVLGADAAIADGLRAARMVAAHLGAKTVQAMPDLEPARRTQQAIGTLFFSPPQEILPATVICRCEGLRRTDLEALNWASSPREVRLVGRFGMGTCQGRFCSRTVSRLTGATATPFAAHQLNGEIPRWPLRPVSVTALAAYRETAENY